jgi:hypothetical protein
MFFDDPVFLERYLADLDRISAPGYLETLFSETHSAFRKNASIIYRDQPFYYFSRKPYLANRATIRKTLHPYRAVSAYVNGSTDSGPLIELGASQPVPVEVTGVRVKGVRGVPEGGPVRLPGKALYEPVLFQTVAFAFPDGAARDMPVPMEVECRVLGTDEHRLESVALTPRVPGTAEMGDLTRLPANAETFEFAVTDDADRTVFLLPGSHRIPEPLVVPEGYALLCGAGTSLDLVLNASIIARGPLEWEGTPERPITVGSSDGTGGGVLVLKARNTSTLVDVHFEPLATPGIAPVSGSVLTFLESPVVLDRVTMRGDGSAPLLRLIGGQFIVTGSAFAGGSAPSVSIEYATGNLTGTVIADGAGLGASGSVLELEECRFERIEGPAVLAERESTVSGTDMACTAIGTGFAAETGSRASLERLSVQDAAVGVRAGAGEAGFEPGRVALAWSTFSNVAAPFVQEDGGTVTVDGGRAVP